MIEETGQVVEIRDGGVAVVLCQKNSMCAHCASSGSCLSAGESGDRLVEVANPIGARVGQKVRLGISSRVFLKSSFIVYILPLVALLVGGGLGQWVGESFPLGLDPNLLAAILGCASLGGAFLAIRLVSRTLRSEQYLPTILGVVAEETMQETGSGHGH